jgi:hypothetical protein
LKWERKRSRRCARVKKGMNERKNISCILYRKVGFCLGQVWFGLLVHNILIINNNNWKSGRVRFALGRNLPTGNRPFKALHIHGLQNFNPRARKNRPENLCSVWAGRLQVGYTVVSTPIYRIDELIYGRHLFIEIHGWWHLSLAFNIHMSLVSCLP